MPIENKAKFGSTISIGKNIIFKNIELIKETKSKYVVMEFGGNDCDYNWREISENPDKYHQHIMKDIFFQIENNYLQ